MQWTHWTNCFTADASCVALRLRTNQSTTHTEHQSQHQAQVNGLGDCSTYMGDPGTRELHREHRNRNAKWFFTTQKGALHLKGLTCPL